MSRRRPAAAGPSLALTAPASDLLHLLGDAVTPATSIARADIVLWTAETAATLPMPVGATLNVLDLRARPSQPVAIPPAGIPPAAIPPAAIPPATGLLLLDDDAAAAAWPVHLKVAIVPPALVPADTASAAFDSLHILLSSAEIPASPPRPPPGPTHKASPAACRPPASPPPPPLARPPPLQPGTVLLDLRANPYAPAPILLDGLALGAPLLFRDQAPFRARLEHAGAALRITDPADLAALTSAKRLDLSRAALAYVRAHHDPAQIGPALQRALLATWAARRQDLAAWPSHGPACHVLVISDEALNLIDIRVHLPLRRPPSPRRHHRLLPLRHGDLAFSTADITPDLRFGAIWVQRSTDPLVHLLLQALAKTLRLRPRRPALRLPRLPRALPRRRDRHRPRPDARLHRALLRHPAARPPPRPRHQDRPHPQPRRQRFRSGARPRPHPRLALQRPPRADHLPHRDRARRPRLLPRPPPQTALHRRRTPAAFANLGLDLEHVGLVSYQAYRDRLRAAAPASSSVRSRPAPTPTPRPSSTPRATSRSSKLAAPASSACSAAPPPISTATSPPRSSATTPTNPGSTASNAPAWPVPAPPASTPRPHPPGPATATPTHAAPCPSPSPSAPPPPTSPPPTSPTPSVTSAPRARPCSPRPTCSTKPTTSTRHPDVREAVANGTLPSGYRHYLQSGFRERRAARRLPSSNEAAEAWWSRLLRTVGRVEATVTARDTTIASLRDRVALRRLLPAPTPPDLPPAAPAPDALPWHPDATIAGPCPVCDAPGPHPALLTVLDHTLARCTGCASCFYADRIPYLYEDEAEAALLQQLYLEQNAGIHQQTALLFAVPGVDSLLDIGCGFGFTVDLAARLGWRATGLDPSAMARAGAAALGADIRPTYLGDDTELARPFSLVIASEVIEHVPNPYPFLATLRAALAPAETLVLTTPTPPHSNPASAPPAPSASPLPRVHLVLFTRDSLALALHRAGFRHVDITAQHDSLLALASDREIRPKDATDDGAHTIAYRDYLAGLLDRAAPGTPLWNGAAGRLFALLAPTADLAELHALFARIADAWRDRFGIDLARLRLPALLDEPARRTTSAAALAQHQPLNLAGVLLNRARLEARTPGRPPDRVLDFARPAYLHALQTGRILQAANMIDHDLRQTAVAARLLILDCLAELAPELETELLRGLAEPAPSDLGEWLDLDPDALVARIAPAYTAAVAAERFDQAARLEPWMRDLDRLGRALKTEPELLLRTLFTIGRYRLHQRDPAAAAAAFHRMADEARRRIDRPGHPSPAQDFLAVAKEHLKLAADRLAQP